MPVCFLLLAAIAAADARDPLPGRIAQLIAAGRPDFPKLASPPAADAEFFRRVYLGLAGTIPTAAEVRAFLDDKSADKRAKLVNKLIDGPGYARRMAWFLDTTLMEN